MSSEAAFGRLGEKLASQVEAALKDATAPRQPVQQESRPEMAREVATAEPKGNVGDSFYTGEVMVRLDADTVELYRVLAHLKSRLKAEILSIIHSERGTTIQCTLRDPLSFLGALASMDKVAGWSLAAA